MDKKYFFIAISIFIFFLLIFSLFPNFLLNLELLIHDNFFNLYRVVNRFSPHLNEIVIVALDDLSFWKLETKWPYPRSVYADLLDKIYKGNPKLVVFDIVFRGDSEDKKSDELFAKALEGKDNVLLPYHFGKLGVHVRPKKDFTKDSGSAGYINKPVDADGVIRKFYPFRLTIDGEIKDYGAELYVFAKYYDYELRNIALKDRYVSLNQLGPKEKDMFKRFNFHLGNDNSIWINYQAKLDDFNVISIYRVLTDSIEPEVFKDKVVFIGATADIFHDIHDTPLGLMPGTAVMANVALMLLDGRFITEAPKLFSWLVVFVFSLFMAFFCYRTTILKGLFFTISIIAILITVTFLLLLNNYYSNPFKLILISIVNYIAINFYKYTSVVLENINLRKLSTIDELTGLYIFRFFKLVLDHEFQKCLRYKMPLSLLMFDIDNFKKINDTYGHQKGNVVLTKIGKIILNNVRRADFPSRYGGEELAILLPNSNLDGAKKCAENLRKLIEKEDFFMTNEGSLKVTVSIGVASFPTVNINSAEEMVKLADTALYTAKRQGKNRTVVYSEGT